MSRQRTYLASAAYCVLLVVSLSTTSLAKSKHAAPFAWQRAKIIAGREAPGFVAFTFDDGPDLISTPKVLSILESFEVPATFFVVGRHFAKKRAVKKPANAGAGALLVQEIERRGFTIGNHTTNHQNLSLLPEKEALQAVAKNASDLNVLLGHPVHLFRPPYGVTTVEVRRMLRNRGDTTVRWNIDSQDFQRKSRKRIAERVLADILRKGGGVVLMHDTKPWTARELPKILAGLERANCQRIARGVVPIIPVSLHYFLRDRNGSHRAIPPDVLETTQAAVDRLTNLCKSTIDKSNSAD